MENTYSYCNAWFWNWQLGLWLIFVKSLLPLLFPYFFCPLPHGITWTFFFLAGWSWRIPLETVRMGWGRNGNSETWIGTMGAWSITACSSLFRFSGIQWQAATLSLKERNYWQKRLWNNPRGLSCVSGEGLSMMP